MGPFLAGPLDTCCDFSAPACIPAASVLPDAGPGDRRGPAVDWTAKLAAATARANMVGALRAAGAGADCVATPARRCTV